MTPPAAAASGKAARRTSAKALVDLPPNLHADDQKEYGHQRIVDPEVQRLTNHEITDADHERDVPEPFVAFGCR
jgi:hypothetical protein